MARDSDFATKVYKNTALTHEARGVGRVGPDLSVDLDQALHDNRQNLLAGQSILEAVAEENRERERFTELVGTGRRAGSLYHCCCVEQASLCAETARIRT